MSFEYGIERYGDLLAGYFKDNPGPPGADGFSTTMIAKEVRQKYLGASTAYTGLTHVISPGELTPDDIILCNIWWEPWSLASLNIAMKWETLSGDLFQTFSFGNNANIHGTFAYAQDAGDTSILVATTYQTLLTGNKSTSGVVIYEPDGLTPLYNWITLGGSVKITITTGAAAGLLPGCYVRAYYYHFKRT